MSNYEQQELEEVVSDFLESCHRTGHHDLDDNIAYFLQENNHIELDENEVREIFEKYDE